MFIMLCQTNKFERSTSNKITDLTSLKLNIRNGDEDVTKQF